VGLRKATVTKAKGVDYDWESVTHCDKDYLDRIRVPGGWLYRSTTTYLGPHNIPLGWTESMCFVPEVK